MSRTTSFAAVAVAATLALAATDLSASAQSTLTNGPNGMRPNTLSSNALTGPNGREPSRAPLRRHAVRGASQRTARPSTYAYRRPLTVRRTVAAQPVVVAAPAVAGPGTLVTGPLGFASNVVSLPFQALGGIFPATGDFATNPLVVIGAPIRAIGDIVQLPFRIIGAPFGGTNIATY